MSDLAKTLGKMESRTFEDRLACRWVNGLLVALFLTCTTYAESPFKRWAIVADARSQSTGVPDLLMAELSKRSFPLLERDALALVEQEQTLLLLFGQSNAEDSARKIGERLNADCLIVVSIDEVKKKGKGDQQPEAQPLFPGPSTEVLRIRVYACQQAVRLGFITCEKSKAIGSIEPIAEAILRIQHQFPDGVRHAIGISPFTARNLEKSFDFLGSKFHDLLSTSLDLTPGVAIVDFENARSMAREFPDEERMKSRVVPWLVEVDYQVAKSDAKKPPRIAFFARRISRDQTITLESGELSMERGILWISQTLPAKLLEHSKENTRLDVNAQIAAMRDRADHYSHFGDFYHATESRESLLLLDPQNVAQRQAVLNDYQSLSSSYFPTANGPMAHRILHFPEEAFRVRRIALDHLQTLIFNRSIDQELAFQYLSYWCVYPVGSLVWQRFYRPLTPEDDERLQQDREYLGLLTPPFLKLPTKRSQSNRDRLFLEEKWSKLVWSTLIAHINAEHFSADEMERVFEAAAAILPPSFATTDSASAFVSVAPKHLLFKIGANGPNPITYDFKLDEEEIARVFQKIAQEKHPHLAIYGQLGLFWLKTREQRVLLDLVAIKPEEVKSIDVKLLNSYIEEANKRIDEIAKRPNANFTDSSFRWGYCDFALSHYVMLRNKFAKGIELKAKPSTPQEDPLRKLKDPSMGRMVFEELPIDLNLYLEQKFEFVPGDRDFDLLIGTRNISRIERSGKATMIHELPENSRMQVIWDGVNVMVMDPSHKLPIEMLDKFGKRVGLIDPTSVFPSYESLNLFVVAPNRLLGIGRLENDSRCWLAMLDLSERVPKAKVFHEARRPFTPSLAIDRPEEAWDVNWVVNANWMGKFRRGNKEFLLLPRYGVHPLTIDLSTLKVDSLGLPVINYANRPLALENHLVFALSDAWAYDLRTERRKLMDGKRVIPWVDSKDQDAGIFAAGNYQGNLFEHEGWVYLPGYAWCRFRPTLDHVERLVPTRLPHEYAQLQVCKSEVFGIVGYRSVEDYDKSHKTKPVIYRISVK